METKVLIVGVVEREGAILMRKKPDGSLPYKETWYIFGAEAVADATPEDVIINQVKQQAGVTVSVVDKIAWDTEVKQDLDGIEKFFVYLDVLCRYESGELALSPGVEKLEWVSKEKLADYDIVPPSRVLFEKLGYL